MDIYTSKEVRSVTRIPERVLILFCERGIVVPFKEASGQGSQRLFHFENLVEIMIAAQMWRFKVSLRLIKNVLDTWRTPEAFYIDPTLQKFFKQPDIQNPDVLILRNFDLDYMGLALGKKSDFQESFFGGEWAADCKWVIIAENDPSINWNASMTAFSTLVIDIGAITAMLKKRV